MGSGLTTRFEVTGVAPFLAKLHEISDPKKLERTTRASLGTSARKVIAPRLAATTGWRYGGHSGRYPTKGILGDARKITARRVKTRAGEYVAISVKYRGWPGVVAAWTVKGTKPHVIRARFNRAGSNSRAGVDSRARRMNRGTSGPKDALLVQGRLVSVVEHPGARPTPFVHAAAQGVERLVMQQLEKDLFAQMEKAARGKK